MAQDLRREATQAMLAQRYAASPDLMAINPLSADDPSENECYLKLSFMSFSLAAVYPVPAYQDWLLRQDLRPAYAYFKRVLKLLQWRCPPTRWNLKAPIDLFALDALSDVFSDARLVWCYRDPTRIVPSLASLLVARRREAAEPGDPGDLGKDQLALWLEAARRATAYRSRPDALAIIDISNQYLIHDPIGTVQRLYSRLALDYSEAFDRALRTRLVERPRGRFGAHNYTPGDFGLSEPEIRAAFASYSSLFPN